MEWVFQGGIFLSGLGVFLSRNPVHSVLFLISVFVNGSGLLLLSGLEFLSLVLLVVYVGAIAVLFLFIVMMMNLKTVELRQSLLSSYPFGLMVLIIFFLQLVYLFDEVWFPGSEYKDWTRIVFELLNIRQIGEVLYTYHGVSFLVSGYLLLVGMIGAIYLTYIRKNRLKKQKIVEQVMREKKSSLQYYQ